LSGFYAACSHTKTLSSQGGLAGRQRNRLAIIVDQVLDHDAGVVDLNHLVLSLHDIALPGAKDLAFVSQEDPFWLVGLAGESVELEGDRRRRRSGCGRRRGRRPHLFAPYRKFRRLYFWLFHPEDVSSTGLVLPVLARGQNVPTESRIQVAVHRLRAFLLG